MILAIGGSRILSSAIDIDLVKTQVRKQLEKGVAEVHVGDCVGVDLVALETIIQFSNENEWRNLRIVHHRIYPSCNLTAEFPAPETFLRMEFFYLHPKLKTRLHNRTVGCLSTVNEAMLFTHVNMGSGSQLFLKTCKTFGIDSTVYYLPSSIQKEESEMVSLFKREMTVKRAYKR